MNERIQEMADKAGAQPVNLPQYVTLDWQRFAELIVRECADVAVFKGSGMIATADVAGYMAAGRSTAARLIKEHFGVEELLRISCIV